MNKNTTLEYLKHACAHLSEARALIEEIHGEYSMMNEDEMPVEDMDVLAYDWLVSIETVEGEIDDLLEANG